VIYSLPFCFVSGCLWRRDFWKFRNYQIANKILDIFSISILFSECFGKNLCRKWTVEKKLYIHYMLQACEIMHIVGGPLQRNDVLTFSSCLNWIEVVCCCPAPLGASFIFTLLSKNAVNWGFFTF